MFLTVLVHDKQLVTAVFPGHVDIFPQFDIAIGTKNHGTAVAPGTEPVGSQPIDAKIGSGPVISHYRRITEVLQFRVFLAGVISHPRRGNGSVGCTGIDKELFNLMAADVTQYSAVLRLFEKPGRP